MRFALPILLAIAAIPGDLKSAPLGTPNRALIETADGSADTPERIELGRTLFFDRRLSGNQKQSCASCHNPELGFSDGRAKGLGTMGKPLGRNTPHLYNLAWNQIFFWDGRAASLEEQALGPIAAEGEMSMPLPQLVKRLDSIPAYRQAFKQAYKNGDITAEKIGQAIAAFERTFIVDNTPFDRFLKGDSNAMGPEAKRGLAVFSGPGRCVVCHDGPNFTDQSFHNLGHKSSDPGREKIASDPSMHGAFKTPGLRNILFSAPYMHDGSIGTLEEVVEFYNRGGEPSANRSSSMKALNLTEEQKQDLIAFLGALSQPLTLQPPKIP